MWSHFLCCSAKELQEECDGIGQCNVREAVLTKGYSLPSKHIIHAVGPIWKGGVHNEANLLHSCYKNSLDLALKNKCKSIAFPLISTDIYGYPKEEAIQIAIAAISEFLVKYDIMVYLVVYDKASFVLSERLFSAVEKYIDDNYVDKHRRNEYGRHIQPYDFQLYNSVLEESEQISESCAPMPSKRRRSLEEVVKQLEESFSEMLLRLIDEKGRTDVETYKRANID